MDPLEGVGSCNEQMESDSLESADAALANGVTRRSQRTEKGKAYIGIYDGQTAKLSIKEFKLWKSFLLRLPKKTWTSWKGI